jgi:hypothetical protein
MERSGKEILVEQFEAGALTAHEVGWRLFDMGELGGDGLPPELVDELAYRILTFEPGRPMRTFSITA